MISAAELGRLAPFVGVAKPALDVLAAHGVETRYRADAVLFLAGSAPRGWYVVIHGKVRVVRGSGPRQHVIHTEGRGTLGEVPLFAGGTHPATGIAAEPTVCGLFSLEALRAAMKADETVAMILLARLATRARNLVDRLDERSAQGVRARLIEYLLLRAKGVTRCLFSRDDSARAG